MKKPWHIQVMEEYHKNRYLEFLDKEHLDQRAKDILNNFITINNEGKIGIHIPSEDPSQFHKLGNIMCKYSMIVWTHICAEFYLRYGPYPNGFEGFNNNLTMPTPKGPLKPKLVDAINKYKGKKGYFVKYGKLKYLENMYQNGYLRIFPASFYKDPSLNPAIRDNELEFTTIHDAEKFKIKKVSSMIDEEEKVIKPKGSVSITYTAPTDYYIYCLSALLSPRLFEDFEADACIVIKDTPRFLDSFMSAFFEIEQKWQGIARSVLYTDPIMPNSKIKHRLFEIKHFRYLYQNEFRIILLPEEEKKNLKYIDLVIDGLKEYTELILLDK